jgi:hypothetical protein
VAVVKFHFCGASTREFLSGVSFRNVFTHRDPRDALVSRMVRFNYDFDGALCELEQIHGYHDDFSKAEALFVAYSDVMSRPVWVVSQLTKHLRIEIDDNFSVRISSQFSLENTRQNILPRLRPDPVMLHDPLSLYHPRHIVRSDTGYWEEHLTLSQERRVRSRLPRWFEEWGYS